MAINQQTDRDPGRGPPAGFLDARTVVRPSRKDFAESVGHQLCQEAGAPKVNLEAIVQLRRDRWHTLGFFSHLSGCSRQTCVSSRIAANHRRRCIAELFSVCAAMPVPPTRPGAVSSTDPSSAESVLEIVRKRSPEW